MIKQLEFHQNSHDQLQHQFRIISMSLRYIWHIVCTLHTFPNEKRTAFWNAHWDDRGALLILRSLKKTIFFSLVLVCCVVVHSHFCSFWWPVWCEAFIIIFLPKMTTYAFASISTYYPWYSTYAQLGIFFHSFVTNAEVKDECTQQPKKQQQQQQRIKNNMFQTRQLTATEDYSCNKIVNCY